MGDKPAAEYQMKILVTGGAGYIGSHACKALAADGFEPVTYDNLSRGNRWAVRWGPFEVGDIADEKRLREVLDHHQPAAVIHFAAFAYVGESVNSPNLYYQNNVCGSATLLTNHYPVEIGSGCLFINLRNVWSAAKEFQSPEEHPQHPINPYGFSKLVVERILSDLDRAYGLRSVSLRYFNAAGADPENDIGEAHDPETHLIPLVLAAARDGTDVTVFGNDYDTQDGTCVRDYVHVSDLAAAHVGALKYLLAGGKTCALNLANSRGSSVLEVIRTAERICGKSITVKNAARRPGDPAILVGLADRAHALLGWTPRRSALEMQIADAWNWMQNRKP